MIRIHYSDRCDLFNIPPDGLEQLDVGCGVYPTGDVNCDLYLNDVGHRVNYTYSPSELPAKAVKNFVLADAQHLPFKDNAFSEVNSDHLIEHVPDPFLMLRELVRVCSDKLVVKCPHRYGDRVYWWHDPADTLHCNFFSKKWFRHALVALKRVCYGKVSYTKFQPVPHALFPLVHLPLEITVEIRKKVNATA